MQSKSLLKEIEKLQKDVAALEGTAQTRSDIQNRIQDYCERFIQSLPKRNGFIASHKQAENFYNYPITDDGYSLDEIITVFEESVDNFGLH